jgi:hypothetical protein
VPSSLGPLQRRSPHRFGGREPPTVASSSRGSLRGTNAGLQTGCSDAACPLCDKEPESIQHLLLGCVAAREVWVWALTRWGKIEWMPAVDTTSFSGGPPCPAPGHRGGTSRWR